MVSFSLLVEVLRHIKEGKITMRSLSQRSGIGKARLRELLTSVPEAARVSSSATVTFDQGSKLRLALYLVRKGIPMEEIACALHWSDFEGLASSVLEEFGFKVAKRVRVKPRMEIDVLGIRSDYALALDCKHYMKTMGLRRLSMAAEKQSRRAELVLGDEGIKREGVRRIVPVVLTLRTEAVKVLAGIPIVPADKLNGFLLDFESYSEQLRWLVEKA